MKSIFFISCFFISCMMFLNFSGFAQTNTMLGNWQNEEKDAVIEIGKGADGTYYGKIIEGTSPQKFDVHNPDASQHAKPLLGKVIMHGFHADGNSLLNGGTIYDPKNGKTYNCKITLKDANTLNIRGFIGAAWMGLGRNTVWTRQ